jgi:hypothetical protein
MGIMREELFVELATNKEHPQHKRFCMDAKSTIFRQTYRPSGRMQHGWSVPEYYYENEFDFTVDREAALKAYAAAKSMVMEQGYLFCKGLRPYTYDLMDSLDRSEPWWGFEFETGYANKTNLAKACEYAWDVADLGVTFDCEGESSYPSEITFAPIEMSKFLDESAPAFKFIKFVDENKLGDHGGGDYIGTHFNFSLPGDPNYTGIARVLNNTLHSLPQDGSRDKFFGRESIYGGAANNGGWIEIKLFRTTYEVERFRYYVKVCHALTRVASACTDYVNSTKSYYGNVYPTNFAEMVEDPNLEPVFATDRSMDGDYDCSYISGGEGYNEYDDDYEEEY